MKTSHCSDYILSLRAILELLQLRIQCVVRFKPSRAAAPLSLVEMWLSLASAQYMQHMYPLGCLVR